MREAAEKGEGENEGQVKPDPTRIGETLPGSKIGLGCFLTKPNQPMLFQAQSECLKPHFTHNI